MPSLKPQNRFPCTNSDHFTHFLGITYNLNGERINHSELTRLSIIKYCLWTCFFALIVSLVYFICLFLAINDATFYWKSELYYIAISNWFILYLCITLTMTFIQIQYQFPVSSIPRSHWIIYIMIVCFINCCLFTVMVYFMVLSHNDKLASLNIKFFCKYELCDTSWNVFFILLHCGWIVIDLLLCLFASQIACFSLNLSYYSSVEMLKSHNNINNSNNRSSKSKLKKFQNPNTKKYNITHHHKKYKNKNIINNHKNKNMIDDTNDALQMKLLRSDFGSYNNNINTNNISNINNNYEFSTTQSTYVAMSDVNSSYTASNVNRSVPKTIDAHRYGRDNNNNNNENRAGVGDASVGIVLDEVNYWYYCLVWIMYGFTLFWSLVIFYCIVTLQESYEIHRFTIVYIVIIVLTSIVKWILKRIARKIDTCFISMKIAAIHWNTQLKFYHSNSKSLANVHAHDSQDNNSDNNKNNTNTNNNRHSQFKRNSKIDEYRLQLELEMKSISFELLTEIFCSSIYFLLYRFLIIYDSPLLWEFIVSKIVHFLSETIESCLKISGKYFHVTKDASELLRTRNNYHRVITRLSNIFLTDESTLYQWQQRVCVDLVCRFLVSNVMAIIVILSVASVFVNWDYWLGFSSHDQYINGLIYLSMSIAVDTLYFLLWKTFVEKYGFVINVMHGFDNIYLQNGKLWLFCVACFAVASIFTPGLG